MSTKILSFGASNSSKSINKKLATFAAGQTGMDVTVLDLNDFEMPIYSIDREGESGIPEAAQTFKQHIREADGFVISLAEHNGAYTAAFKNIFDWVSRIEQDVWGQKPMFLMATSPGKRGGVGVLELAHARFGFANKTTIATFSLPAFYDNFDEEKGLTNEEYLAKFNEQLAIFKAAF